MNNLNKILEMAPTTAGEIKDVCLFAVDELNESDGEISALEQSIKAKALMKSLESYLEQIGPKALEEAEKIASSKEKSFTLFGATITVAELGTKYLYDRTMDPKLPELDEAAKVAKAALDARQKFLKNLDGAFDYVDEESGEVVKIFPARKESKTGLKVSFGGADE